MKTFEEFMKDQGFSFSPSPGGGVWHKVYPDGIERDYLLMDTAQAMYQSFREGVVSIWNEHLVHAVTDLDDDVYIKVRDAMQNALKAPTKEADSE